MCYARRCQGLTDDDDRWDLVDPPQVLNVFLESKMDPQVASDALVKKVLDLGAHDNVSVMVVDLKKK